MPLFTFVRGQTGNAGNVAFRKWYSFLNELRSLVSNGLPFMALTATASKHTKREIFRVLEFTTLMKLLRVLIVEILCMFVNKWTVDKK